MPFVSGMLASSLFSYTFHTLFVHFLLHFLLHFLFHGLTLLACTGNAPAHGPQPGQTRGNGNGRGKRKAPQEIPGSAQHQQRLFEEARQRQYDAGYNHANQHRPLPPRAPAPAPLPPPPLPPPPALLECDVNALVQHVLSYPRAHPHGACYCLGLASGATADAVRKQYKQLALRLHPDKCAHAKAREAFDAVHSAYNKLGGGS